MESIVRSPVAEADSDETLAPALKAFGHPKRLRLLRFVTQPRSLEDIAGHLALARQSAKEHLDVLVDQGLVVAKSGKGDRGRVTHYVAAVPRLFDLYDRFGGRIGILAGDLEEDLQGHLPTSPLAEAPSHRRSPESPRLVIVHGMRIGHTIPLQGQGPWLIGRDPKAALCLDYDPYVSHRHAELRRGGSSFEVADALSSNGTWIDWQPVGRGAIAPLVNGSLLRFGRTLVLFRAA